MDSSNTKSGKQEKLGEVKKSSFLEGRGGGGDGGVVLLGRGQKIFIFRVGCPITGEFNFLGRGWYPSAHYALTHYSWMIDRRKEGQYFSEIFWVIQKTGAKFQVLLNLGE